LRKTREVGKGLERVVLEREREAWFDEEREIKISAKDDWLL